MAGNIAKSFATMKLLYWKPIPSGSGMKYEPPVEFKGRYIGNAQMEAVGGISDFIASGGGQRDNLVLFYLCEPQVEGYVSWSDTLETLDAEGLSGLPPADLRQTHKIKAVTTFVMLSAKTSALKDMAFIASVV